LRVIKLVDNSIYLTIALAIRIMAGVDLKLRATRRR
jgi:hypothetical protein